MGMTLLVIGVVLWSVAHTFKRIAPVQRAAMSARMGDRAKGVIAIALVVAIVLMVVGYQRAGETWLWLPQPWMMHLNNLLVLVGFYVFGIGMAKGALSQKLRHPMLTGTLIWALAHLLVRGHVAGVILFGGLALWAVVAMMLINSHEPRWTPPARKDGPRDLVAAGIVLVVFGAVGWLHGWLGPNPFGGAIG